MNTLRVSVMRAVVGGGCGGGVGGGGGGGGGGGVALRLPREGMPAIASERVLAWHELSLARITPPGEIGKGC